VPELSEQASLLEHEAVAGKEIEPEPSDPWALCGAPEPPLVPVPPGARGKPVERNVAAHLSGQRAEAFARNFFVLSGNAVAKRADQLLAADRITYDAAQERVEAQGNVRYGEYDLSIEGQSGYLQLDTDQGGLDEVRYRLHDRHGRGTAATMRLESPSLSRFTQVTYTTCNPDDSAWQLKASRLKLNREEGVGTAHHARLALKNIPVFYTPYITFPIDDRRKSGFLVPSFGHSSRSGFDLEIPYYWNIAPNMDATLAPRLLTRRGFQFLGEFRYLTENHHGELYGEGLPDDREFGRGRGLISFTDSGHFLTPRLTTNLIVHRVSDERYFGDLGNNLSLASITYLESRADLYYAGHGWSLLGRAQDFQTVDETIAPPSRPYRRLPQLLFHGHLSEQRLGLSYALRNEFVRFDHDVGVTGERIDLRPTISLPIAHPAFFLTPSASMSYTQYFLDGRRREDSTPTRTLPIVSLDSGLFLERRFTLSSRALLQTLEPRLYYLYVPFEDQSDIPNFDSTALNLRFFELFLDNRFSGGDRIGDANQLTLALTTRLFDALLGSERLRASIGQIIYFRDREVTLPGQPLGTDRVSHLVAELFAALPYHVKLNAEIQWNPEQDQLDRGIVRVQYRPARDWILNLAYRSVRNAQKTERESLDQTDVSLVWPLGRQWHMVARWNYSIEDDRTLEVFGGLEYDSCCFALRGIVRRFVRDIEGDVNTSFLLQLELKGLTSIGQKVEELLEERILGYTRDSNY
jgi:Organic solvent tolerance protein OstA